MSELWMDLTRTVVIGNWGAGKSCLAERIAGRFDAAYVDLDLIHWLPGGYDLGMVQDLPIPDRIKRVCYPPNYFRALQWRQENPPVA